MQLKRVCSKLPCQHNTEQALGNIGSTRMQHGNICHGQDVGRVAGGAIFKGCQNTVQPKREHAEGLKSRKKKKHRIWIWFFTKHFAGLEPSIFPPRSLSDTFGLLYMKIHEQRNLSVTEPTQSALWFLSATVFFKKFR